MRPLTDCLVRHEADQWARVSWREGGFFGRINEGSQIICKLTVPLLCLMRRQLHGDGKEVGIISLDVRAQKRL